MRNFYYIAAFALLLFSTSAFSADETVPQTLPGGLVRVPNARLSLAYVRPGTDWSKYKTIRLAPLDVPEKARNTAGRGERPRIGQRFVMNDKEVASLQESFDETTRKELAKGGFTFVDTPQADTLIITPQVLKITLNAPIDDNSGPRSRTYTKGAGSMAIAAVFSDGASGTVIAQAAARAVSDDHFFSRNLKTDNRMQARQAFRTWAGALRQRLLEKQIAAH